jgi:hypothetical protein
VGECATVRDTFGAITIPSPVTFTPTSDAASSTALPAGSPPALQQRVCVPTNFAYVMAVNPLTSATGCGDYTVRVWRRRCARREGRGVVRA